jgi:glycosyltransferase involved in cell wall biosynthesis
MVDRFYGPREPQLKAVLEAVDTHGVGDRVTLVPQVGYEQLGTLLGRAGLGVSILAPVPGYTDATPTKLFEYMAYTAPVIGFDLPGHREIIVGNDCGWVFPEFTGESMADCLERVLPDVDARYEKGLNGFHAFREKYCWEHEARRLVELYERLARPGRPNPQP